tara:strand:- start:445 stop:567 length:123 start_codon:yes stop_codon:yes gene_type:complete
MQNYGVRVVVVVIIRVGLTPHPVVVVVLLMELLQLHQVKL